MRSKTKNINNISFIIEVTVFGSCALLFFIMNFFGNIRQETANTVYIIFISTAFGWLFSFETILKKFDVAVHTKNSKDFYKPVSKVSKRTDYKRKGLKGVVFLWIFYLAFVGFLRYIRILTWQLFLCGMSVLFLLNTFFMRKKCLLSVLFLKNKNHCCKYCGINSWDYAIFSSALIFAPQMSKTATVINIIIIFLSFLNMFIWELTYRKHPYRFYPETNANLSCKNCSKKCNRTHLVNKGETYEI